MQDKSLQKCLKYRDGWYFWRAHSKATCEHRSTELSVVPKGSSQPASCYHTSPAHSLGINGSTLGFHEQMCTGPNGLTSFGEIYLELRAQCCHLFNTFCLMLSSFSRVSFDCVVGT